MGDVESGCALAWPGLNPSRLLRIAASTVNRAPLLSHAGDWARAGRFPCEAAILIQSNHTVYTERSQCSSLGISRVQTVSRLPPTPGLPSIAFGVPKVTDLWDARTTKNGTTNWRQVASKRSLALTRIGLKATAGHTGNRSPSTIDPLKSQSNRT